MEDEQPTPTTVRRACRDLREAREELATAPGYMAALKVQLMKVVHDRHRQLRLV